MMSCAAQVIRSLHSHCEVGINFHSLLLTLILSSKLVLEMTSNVDVHHAPYKISPPVSVPVSASIPSVSKELGSTSSSAPECPSTVTLTSVIDYCPFRICHPRTPIVLPSNVYMD